MAGLYFEHHCNQENHRGSDANFFYYLNRLRLFCRFLPDSKKPIENVA